MLQINAIAAIITFNIPGALNKIILFKTAPTVIGNKQ